MLLAAEYITSAEIDIIGKHVFRSLAEAFSGARDADPEMHIIGDWFTTAFSLSCEDQRCIVRFDRGRLVEFIVSPQLDVRCAFGFRASREIWTRFFSKDPEPLYHDFFAKLMRVPGFVLEGDTLAAMQNARALHRTMNIMKAAAAAD